MRFRNLCSGLFVLALMLIAAGFYATDATPTAWAQEQAQTHKAVGVIKEVDRERKMVTISHGPVETLKWQSMTMAFTVMDPKLLDTLPVGKEIEFEFQQHGTMYMIMRAK